MGTLKLFGLAAFQGVAEFLPISSSGHLAILDEIFGLDVLSVRTGVFLHFGTLLAIVLFYRKWLAEEIAGLFRLEREAWRIALAFLLSMLPAVAFYGLLGGETGMAQLQDNVRLIGLLLVATGVILLTTKFAARGDRQHVSPLRAVLIGCAQALAILPGISRSGATISCARHLGIAPEKAVGFSFIMTVPLLLGATVMEVAEGEAEAGEAGFSLWTLCAAAAIAAIVGYFSIRILVRVLSGGGFWRFGIYCLAVGILAALFG